MDTYRDMATALARGRPEPYVGAVYYAELPHAGVSPRWDVQTFPRPSALRAWYEEVVPSHAWYYVAAFDKTRGFLPVGELTAPPKPGRFSFDVRRQWRHPPYGSAAAGAEAPTGDGMVGRLAKTVGLFALVALPLGFLISRSKERQQTETEKAEFRRLGWDWEKRYR